MASLSFFSALACELGGVISKGILHIPLTRSAWAWDCIQTDHLYCKGQCCLLCLQRRAKTGDLGFPIQSPSHGNHSAAVVAFEEFFKAMGHARAARNHGENLLL